MEKDKLENILNQLYEFYPELESHKEKLLLLISEMIKNKPDTKFDQSFAFNLKEKLAAYQVQEKFKNKDNKFNLNIMNKKIFIAAGSLIFASILFFVFINIYGPEKEPDSWNIASLLTNQKKVDDITYLPAGSFGSLAALSSAGGNEAGENVPLGLGSADMSRSGGGGVTSSSEVISIEPGDSRMIMPMKQGYKYVYTGDEVNLENISDSVYRRIKNQDTMARDLARSLSSFDFSGINLKSFDNLKVNNISFSEDKEQGLMISFDLREGSVYIGEDWNKWRVSENEVCIDGSFCNDNNRISIDDVPADNELISLADSFLASHKIDMNNYGEAQVDNNWRQYYGTAENKENVYVPEQLSVIYPLLIEDGLVRDQSGNFTGLRVTVNIRHNKASGLSGLMPYRYEASSYDLENDTEKIVTLAEDGGWNRNYYYEDKEDLLEIKLGTPEFSYVQMWRYKDNQSQELLVPALMFPIIDKPEFGYFGGNYVVVPLVKELIDELDKQKDNWLLMRDNVEPALPIDTMPEIIRDTEGGGGGVSGEMNIMPIQEPEVTR